MVLSFGRPIHPGEFLREEFLVPLSWSPKDLAVRIHVSESEIVKLIDEEIPLTVDVALRLARLFGTTPEFWANFQTNYDLETTEKKLTKDLEAIEPLPKQDAA